jgi:hypothetical protein
VATLVTLKELRDNPPEPTRNLWGDGWITDPSLNIVAAEPKVGKSLLMMGLSAALADPECDQFLRQPVANARILYLNEEITQAKVYERFASIHPDRGEWETNLVINESRRIRLDTNFAELGDLATAAGANLVVVDPVARFHNWDEASNQQMGLFMNEAVWPVVRAGVTVILVHHFNKMVSGDTRHLWARIRGATRLIADADGVFALIKDTPDGSEIRLSAILRNAMWHDDLVLYRDPTGKDLSFYLDQVADEDMDKTGGAEEAADGPTGEEFIVRLCKKFQCSRKRAVEYANRLLRGGVVRLDEQRRVWMC